MGLLRWIEISSIHMGSQLFKHIEMLEAFVNYETICDSQQFQHIDMLKSIVIYTSFRDPP
jgi:hypothetical protein